MSEKRELTREEAKLIYKKHRGSLLERLRYNWWIILLHLVLITFGVLNLYPFLWMMGTSFKAEAEASNERLAPIPEMKYKLAEGFDPNRIVPPFLDADIAAAETHREWGRRLSSVVSRLEMLQEMQRRAMEPHLLQKLARAWLDRNEFYEQSKLVVAAQEENLKVIDRRIARVKETLDAWKGIKALRKKLDALSADLRTAEEDGRRKTLRQKIALLSERIVELEKTGPTAKARLADLKAKYAAGSKFLAEATETLDTLRLGAKIKKDSDERTNGIAATAPGRISPDGEGGKLTYQLEVYDLPSLGGPATKAVTTQPAGDKVDGNQAVLTKLPPKTTITGQTAYGVFKLFQEKNILVEDPAHGGFWLSDAAQAGEFPAGLSENQLATAKEVREYYLVTPSSYKKATKVIQVQLDRQLPSLTSGPEAALVQVRQAKPAGENTPAVEPAYVLADWARGTVHDGLRPRQLLTLLRIWQENQRRHESRTTFAADRWSVGAYEKNYGLENAVGRPLAKAEINALLDKNLLTEARLQFMNYWVVLKEENLILNFLTSVLITATVVILTVLASSMLGYALARIRFPGKFLVLGVMIAASILPGEARIIPIFKMLMAVGLMKNLWGLVLWLTSFGVGNALLMAGFFLTLPKEVDEAAEVDGAGVFRKFFDIALPMARPIVMTVGLFAFLTAWNNFLIPLLCTISRPSMQPLAVAVYNFQQGHPGKWHQINAAAAVMIVPVIVLFLLVQRHVVKSIAIGAVKG